MSESEIIEEQFKALLDKLLVEKYKNENHGNQREIAVVYTEVQKSYAYFKVYIQPYMEAK